MFLMCIGRPIVWQIGKLCVHITARVPRVPDKTGGGEFDCVRRCGGVGDRTLCSGVVCIFQIFE